MVRPCHCLSSRIAALIAGSFDLTIGVTGVSLLLLNPVQRHFILNPITENSDKYGSYDPEYLHYDTEGEQIKFLLEYWFPSLALSFLGLLLIIASTTRNACLTILSFIVSLVLVTGCTAGIASLMITGSSGNFLGALPLILITFIQIYIHWVITDFSKHTWLPERSEDKTVLVDTTV